MPAPTAPTTYRSMVPLESYQDLAESMKRTEEETAKIQEQRYQEVGTPAELGARQAGRRAGPQRVQRVGRAGRRHVGMV